MMGIAVPDLTAPVLKNTNAVIALDQKDAVPAKESACIRCGACYNHCPFRINPAAIARAYSENDCDGMVKAGVDTCMECGCCSFVCPAGRPLVQTNKLAKAVLREQRAAKKKKEGGK